MRNYLGYFIILVLLCTLIISSAIQFQKYDKILLIKAYDLKNAKTENIKDIYNQFKIEFKKAENGLMMLVNHASYKEISQCMLRIENDISYGCQYNLENHIDELILCLEEMIKGEKTLLNNIF